MRPNRKLKKYISLHNVYGLFNLFNGECNTKKDPGYISESSRAYIRRPGNDRPLRFHCFPGFVRDSLKPHICLDFSVLREILFHP